MQVDLLSVPSNHFIYTYVLENMTTLGTAITVVQAIFYASPLIIAATTLGLAWWRFKIFRIREPAIRTDLIVSSRPASPSYNALSAVAVMTNTSKVAAVITGLEWSVFVLSPYTDADVENKIAEYSPHMQADDSPYEFPWNVNYRVSQQNPRIFLEPGESNTISMSLAIPDWIEAVDVLLELDTPIRGDGPPMCWTARGPHDIGKE